MDKELICYDEECSFSENGICTYGGLIYERPCYEDKGYFEDQTE